MWRSFKKIVRKVTPKKVKEFFAYQEGVEFATIVYSQEGEDILLKRIFEHSPPGFYVDVGAHHPFRFSNTKLLYDMGWTGINIDPNPDVKLLFEKYRSRDIFVNCGVSLNGGRMDYHIYKHPALNTFDIDQVNNRKEKPIRTEKIKTRPLKDILNDLNFNRKIDLLTIDVEGFDLEVLKSLDWDTQKPDWILIEDFAKAVDDSEILKFLNSKKYKLRSMLWNSYLYRGEFL